MKPISLIRSTVVVMAMSGLLGSLWAGPSPADVHELLSSYHLVRQALADDDVAAARVAAGTFAETARQLDASATLIGTARLVADAADIEVARAGFQQLSNAMAALVTSVGTGPRIVYLFRCPMAFAGKGGTWLQDAKTTANPYFGSSMLRCGEIVKELGGTLTVPRSGHTPGIH